jgi:hypothetical protein
MKSKLNGKSVKVLGSVESVMIDVLSPVFPQDTLTFHTVRIEEFAKLLKYRIMFKNHPLYIGTYEKTEEELRQGVGIILDSISFDKSELTLSTMFKGFKVTGKASFIGGTSKFYIPAGIIYSVVNNRVESSIPKDFLNTIVEVNIPAVASFGMLETNTAFGKKFLVTKIAYLFKGIDKFLVVKPFTYSGYYGELEEKTITLRFFEFLLNLTQFFNENEKVEPYFWEVVRPKLLTDSIFDHVGQYRSVDPAHEHSIEITSQVNLIASDNYIVEQVNKAYTRARTSFPFLGQEPVEALENFVRLIKLVG